MTDRLTDTTILGNNSLHLMHSMQPKKENIITTVLCHTTPYYPQHLNAKFEQEEANNLTR